jgi:hypothetical protein
VLVMLPQTSRNRAVAEKVDALLAQAKNLGIDQKFQTRRQARKALKGYGTLK